MKHEIYFPDPQLTGKMNTTKIPGNIYNQTEIKKISLPLATDQKHDFLVTVMSPFTISHCIGMPRVFVT